MNAALKRFNLNPQTQMCMLGTCRGPEDEAYVAGLQEQIDQMRLQVGRGRA